MQNDLMRPSVPTVLVAADSAAIEALAADLVSFAGFRPVLVPADSTPTTVVNRGGIDLVLLDGALPPRCVEPCVAAARERRIAVVFFSGTMSESEVRDFALRHGAPYFALPNGPRLLHRVLATAISGSRGWAQTPVPSEIAMATRAVARARGALVSTAPTVVDPTRRPPEDRDALLAGVRARRDELREAVLTYSESLRSAGLSRSRAVEVVSDVMRESAFDADAPALLATLDADARQWVDEVYRAG
ncbi:MAG TPA: hypothetical protein VF159_11835 [Gemmatimonadaceae bacterium]